MKRKTGAGMESGNGKLERKTEMENKQEMVVTRQFARVRAHNSGLVSCALKMVLSKEVRERYPFLSSC